MIAPPVRPELGPTLPEAVEGRRPGAGRLVVPVLAALAAVLVLGALLARGEDGRRLVVDGPIAFNLRHEAPLREVAPRRGELARLEHRRADGLFVQSFSVRPLVLPPYRGLPSGVLPIAAERRHLALRAQVPAYEPVDEGRVRVNDVPGYRLAYKGRTADGRRVYESRVLLVPDVPGARQGLELVLTATPASGVPGADRLGTAGTLKLPLRSFRFGIEPG